jgi:hypothetical protein
MECRQWTFFRGGFLENTNMETLKGLIYFPAKCNMISITPKNKNERALQTGLPRLWPTNGREHPGRSAVVLPLI